VQAEISTNLKAAGLIVGVILLGSGLVMLGVRLWTDVAWENAEAHIERVGVVCDLKWVELSFSRRPYRPHYRTLPCNDVAGFQAQHPELNATIKEVTTVEVRFTGVTGNDLRATGRHSPHGWRAPSIGETVPITYNPANPADIAWRGSAMPMYLAGGIIAFVGAGLTWLGWPSSQSTRGPTSPASPGVASQGFATRSSNKHGGFGRRARPQSR
jgi:hypothetical protein